jgi:hypothetical protein
MTQAKALAKPDFISERIQLNEAAEDQQRVRLRDLQRRLLEITNFRSRPTACLFITRQESGVFFG